MFNFLKRNTGKSIHVNDIDGLIGTINLIDIREPSEFRTGSIKTAKNIPMNTLLSNPEKYLKKDQSYYLVCHSGARSQSTCSQLIKAGYDVTNVVGGIGSYVGSKRQ
ncbi:MAG TPA: rhodanese-like domain-containing protein [Bacillota bacterium]|nr:rhodanese-like domain-containing protein [Bacillota bacterium]